MKYELSRIVNFTIKNFAKFILQILLRNPHDQAWKNKDVDRSNIPKQPLQEKRYMKVPK